MGGSESPRSQWVLELTWSLKPLDQLRCWVLESILGYVSIWSTQNDSNKKPTHEIGVLPEQSSDAGSETMQVPISPVLPGGLAIRNIVHAVQSVSYGCCVSQENVCREIITVS